MFKKVTNILIPLVAVPIVIVLGVTVFESKQYALISLALSILVCVPMLLTFEKQKTHINKLVVLAAMIALCVVGRFVFSFAPGFKPVTAMIVITAIYFGPQAGFLTGALTAVISNFYFGQGPWTPFQMFSWGLIGLLAGVLSQPLKQSRLLQAVFGILSGILFSLLMDLWTAVWWDDAIILSRYLALVVAALPMTLTYAFSNCVFLVLLTKPIGKKLERIKIKYGIK